MSSPAPLKSLSDLREESPGTGELWVVDITTQQMYRSRKGRAWEVASVSTSRVGTGSEPNSNRTPLGWHQVSEIIGIGGPSQQEFMSRKPVPPSSRDDRILSRILWLDGVEPGINETSHARYIYIHGTNHPEVLGTTASIGCVRMDPEVIAVWADECGDIKPKVWIGNLSSKVKLF